MSLSLDVIVYKIIPHLSDREYFSLMVAFFPDRKFAIKLRDKTKDKWDRLHASTLKHFISVGGKCCDNMPKTHPGKKQWTKMQNHRRRCRWVVCAFNDYFKHLKEPNYSFCHKIDIFAVIS
jgi:hypothetical protein